MNKRFKKQLWRLLILLAGIPILLWNCNNDESFDDNSEHYGIEPEYYKSLISFNHFKENDKTYSLFFKSLKKQGIQSKSGEGFKNFNYITFIDSSKVISFSGEEKKTYTFPITTLLDKNEGDFFNLVIEEYRGLHSAFVVKYTPLTNFTLNDVNQDLSTHSFKLNFFNNKGKQIGALETKSNQSSQEKSNKKSLYYKCPPQFEALYDPCDCGGNADGHAPSGSSCCKGSPYIGYKITFDCGGGGENINEDTAPTWQDDLDAMNEQGQLGDISDTTGGIEGGTPTSPIGIDNLVAIIDFYSQQFQIILSSNQSDWLLKNQEQDFMIRDFILKNNKSDEAKNFAIQVIDALMNNGEVDFDELFIETSTPDDNYIFQGEVGYIPNPLILNNGEQISITFGTTKSDNISANQEVSIDLINGLKFALENANSNLTSSEKITSIYIMATTNGKHSTTSNHSKGTAMDISRINGEKMILSGVTNQIKELQKGFDNYSFIRENFGPYFKHKYYKENGTWNYNYPVGGHKDHIHISIRR